MAATYVGTLHREGMRDKDGHREYQLISLVKTSNKADGPGVVMATSGLPVIGAYWAVGNDSDTYARCWPNMKVTPRSSSKSKPEAEKYWEVEQLFSTKPLNRCQDDSITDPLAEPQRVSGSFIKLRVPCMVDRNGKTIKSSSHELVKGFEKDQNHPTVCIEQNVATLGLATFAEMVDTLNDATLWGLTSRKIKLSNASWERKLYGTCTYYYTRRFDFEVAFEGWDEAKIPDTGWKVLRGEWNAAKVWVVDPSADKDNPEHFVLRTDYNHRITPARIELDGNGNAQTDPSQTDYIPGGPVEVYEESNFLSLGIPTSF